MLHVLLLPSNTLACKEYASYIEEKYTMVLVPSLTNDNMLTLYLNLVFVNSSKLSYFMMKFLMQVRC